MISPSPNDALGQFAQAMCPFHAEKYCLPFLGKLFEKSKLHSFSCHYAEEILPLLSCKPTCRWISDTNWLLYLWASCPNKALLSLIILIALTNPFTPTYPSTHPGTCSLITKLLIDFFVINCPTFFCASSHLFTQTQFISLAIFSPNFIHFFSHQIKKA